MSGMDDILIGRQDLRIILQQCMHGLFEAERERVLQEFAIKFIEKMKEHLSKAMLQEENWKRLEKLSIEDSDMAGLERPEPLELVKRRLSEGLETLKEYVVPNDAMSSLEKLISN